jgi:hypothetical protein
MNGKPLLKEKDKPRKERRLSLSGWRHKCDRLMQEKGRLISPKSLLSGLPSNVQHHFVPKSVSARLRYYWPNLIPLTNGEHLRLHQSGDPSYELRIIEIKGQDWWKDLQEKKREIIKVNQAYYKEVYQRLSAV